MVRENRQQAYNWFTASAKWWSITLWTVFSSQNLHRLIYSRKLDRLCNQALMVIMYASSRMVKQVPAKRLLWRVPPKTFYMMKMISLCTAYLAYSREPQSFFLVSSKDRKSSLVSISSLKFRRSKSIVISLETYSATIKTALKSEWTQ